VIDAASRFKPGEALIFATKTIISLVKTIVKNIVLLVKKCIKIDLLVNKFIKK